MRLARLSYFATIFAALWLLAAMPARAGVLKCESRTMRATDYAAMKRAATKAAAPRMLNWSDPTPCMNPGRGRVWVNVRPAFQPDGTRIDSAVICMRESGPWKCEVESQRRYEFSLPISGRDQKFKLSIPIHLTADEARDFVAVAFEKAASITVQDACDRRSNEARTAQDDEYDRDLQATFAASDEPFEGSVAISNRGMTLSTNSYSLEFSRATPSDPWIFRCWWEVIVVT